MMKDIKKEVRQSLLRIKLINKFSQSSFIKLIRRNPKNESSSDNLLNDKKNKGSSINEKIRNSGFVHYDSVNSEGFKNSAKHSIMKKVKTKLQNLIRRLNSFIEKPRLWLSFIDWKKTKTDIIPWSLEVIIEGLIANWWTHKIFGLDFDMGMIIAHGLLINQGLDLHQKIKKDGQHSQILTKNK